MLDCQCTYSEIFDEETERQMQFLGRLVEIIRQINTTQDATSSACEMRILLP